MLRKSSIYSLFFLLFLPFALHADVELAPSRIDFGAVAVEQVAQAQVLVLNDDDEEIRIEEVGQRNAQDGTFFIVHDECSGESLRARQSCRFVIGFYPTEVRSYSGRIDVTYTEGRNRSSRETVRVSGEGVRRSDPPAGPQPPGSPPPGNEPPPSTPPPAPPAQPPSEPLPEPPGGEPAQPPTGLSLSVDAEEVTFGAVYLGTRTSGSLILINTGGVPVVLGEIVPTEAFSAPFALRGDGCSQRTLLPGSRCGLRIEYLPWDVGNHSAALDILYGEPERAQGTLRVFATGTGQIEPGNTPPETPVLIHPLPGQDNLRRSVTFRWESSLDPDGDPVGYWVFYSQDPEFAEAVPARLEPGRTRLAAFGLGAIALTAAALPMRRRVRIILCGTALLSLLVACSDDIEDNATMPAFHLEPKTTYYWKVVAEDGRGGIAQSEVRSFTTR